MSALQGVERRISEVVFHVKEQVDNRLFPARRLYDQVGVVVDEIIPYLGEVVPGDLSKEVTMPVSRAMVKASLLSEETKDFLLNPPEKDEWGHPLGWRPDFQAIMQVWSNEKSQQEAVRHGGFKVAVRRDSRWSWREVYARGEREAGEWPFGIGASGYILTDLGRLEESGEGGLQRSIGVTERLAAARDLVKFAAEAYQSHVAVEQLLENWREKKVSYKDRVLLMLPVQISPGGVIEVVSGKKINSLRQIKPDPLLDISTQTVACVMKFHMAVSSPESLTEQLQRGRIPFYRDRIDEAGNMSVMENYAVLFKNGTADLVTRGSFDDISEAQFTTRPIPLEMAELLVLAVLRAQALGFRW